MPEKYYTRTKLDPGRKEITIREYDHMITSKTAEPDRRTTKETKKHKARSYVHPPKRSLSRSKKIVMDTIQANEDEFITFVTLTFAENVTNFDQAMKEFQTYTRKVRSFLKKKNIDFCYLAIPEFQKRGAVHFHMLCNVPVGSELIPQMPEKKICSEGKYITIDYYNLKYWDKGYSQAYAIEKKNDAFNLGLYMTKYITKNFKSKDSERLYGRQKVLKSQNLKKLEEIKSANPFIRDTLAEFCEEKVTAKYSHIAKSPCEPQFTETTYIFDSKEDYDYIAGILESLQ